VKHGALIAAAVVLFGGCALIAGLEDGELRPGATATGGNGGTGQGGDTDGGGGSGNGGAAGPGGNGAGGGGMGGGTGGIGGMVPGMINIPGDTFMMGCNDAVDDECAADESPYHSITLSSYRIDINEVTRGDYFDCVEAGMCNEPTCDWDPTGMNLQDHPVTCVSWQDAADYCDFAGKRLPTEAEWEYAARGQTGNRYPWGNSFADDCSLANGNLCSKNTSPVGSHPTGASPFGAMDMSGNVNEWVNDHYQQDYYATSPATNPQGPASGGTRALRGGGWNSATFDFRTSSRDAQAPTFFDGETGFRCAM
jgi:formylglycine-generating enzyme required for sulfatase activity